MVGALVGMRDIPIYMVNKLINYDCTKTKEHGGIARPDFLSINKHLLPNIRDLVACRPKDGVQLTKKRSFKIDIT